MIRRPSASPRMKKLIEEKGVDQITFISETPNDPIGCDCKPLLIKYTEMKSHGVPAENVTCPRDKSGMKQYFIMCSNCKAHVATVWSVDKIMSDYCDLHYMSTTDGEVWYGALSLNQSPINGILGIECACGNDTRDFRSNTTLPPKIKDKKIKENDRGRSFGKRNSKFKLKEIKNVS